MRAKAKGPDESRTGSVPRASDQAPPPRSGLFGLKKGFLVQARSRQSRFGSCNSSLQQQYRNSSSSSNLQHSRCSYSSLQHGSLQQCSSSSRQCGDSSSSRSSSSSGQCSNSSLQQVQRQCSNSSSLQHCHQQPRFPFDPISCLPPLEDDMLSHDSCSSFVSDDEPEFAD